MCNSRNTASTVQIAIERALEKLGFGVVNQQ